MAQIDIKFCIMLIALGLTVSVLADKQTDGGDQADALPALHIQVNDAAMRESPSFLSTVALTLNYGDTVGVVDETEDWHKVQPGASSVAGWVHDSALTRKTIKLEAGETDENVQASKQELAAGGRGFNQEVEEKFREENTDLEASYRELDQIEADPAGRASRAEIIRFMREGELAGQGGGQ